MAYFEACLPGQKVVHIKMHKRKSGLRMASEWPWIFPSSVKPGCHLTKLNNAHARVLRDTGLNFVLYDFRHTAATRWAERGMPLATLAKLLGQANLRSVMKYVHPSQEHMDEAMLRFRQPMIEGPPQITERVQ